MRSPALLRLGWTSIALLLAFPAGSARAQATTEFAPQTEMLTTFSGENWGHLCYQGSVRPVALLGELARSYKLNFFALPERPQLLDRPIPDTIEARAAAWIITAIEPRAPHAGLDGPEFAKLNDIALALGDYLQWATSARAHHRYQATVSSADPAVRPALISPRAEASAERTRALLLGLFGPVLGIRPDAQVTLSCLPDPDAHQPLRTAGETPPSPGRNTRPRHPAQLAVRGQIDDLAVLRGTDEFKKASSATLAFTDNNAAGTTNFAINGVIGLGTNFGPNNALFGFVQYTRNDNETDAVGDDDDSKDVHSISPGLFFRRPEALGHSIYGTLGLTAYATFDLRNDAQLVRGRLVFSDITLALPVGNGFLCGQQRRLLFLFADCRLGGFIEAAEVLNAGRNVDLQNNVDDEYVGMGGQAGLLVSPDGPAWLRPLNFTLNYRIMHILSGRLHDPHRLEFSLAYAIPLGPPAGGPGLSFGISRTRGANFETFQHEDLWKLTVGFKF